MISILMPIYNGAMYVDKTIQSVLKNNFKNFEFLIIDDGSTDNTAEIIKSFSDYRIKYYKKQNSGIAETLNFGLKKTNFELVARIDSDDLIKSNRLEMQHNYFKYNKIDVLGSNAYLIDKNDNVLGNTRFPLTHKQIKKKLEKMECPIIHPSVMYKKSKILSVGGYREKYADDYELWLRLIKNSTFENLSNSLIYLRKHSNNLSSSKPNTTQTIIVNSLINYYGYSGADINEFKNNFINSKSSLLIKLDSTRSSLKKLIFLPLYLKVKFLKKLILIRIKWKKY